MEKLDLLILGKPYEYCSSIYRGTDRYQPYYVESLPADHLANQLFDWYSQGAYEDGAVHDLDTARRLVEVHKTVNPLESMEIVEVTSNDHPPIVGSKLLGYDISAGYRYSLLETGLREVATADLGDDPVLRLLQPLMILLKLHFQSLLNKNGLLPDHAAAKLCLDCMMALQQLRPNLWENESVIFDSVGVWLVDAT